MTNYENLFQDHIKDAEFAKFYAEVTIERIVSEMLNDLKEKSNGITIKELYEKHTDQF